MLIQNKNLANKKLSLRYARDARDLARPAIVQGDDAGVFDVPDKDAMFLLNTEGWNRPKKRRGAPAIEAATPLLDASEATPPAHVSPDESEPETPDVDGLRTKAAALEMAAKFGVELDEDLKLSEMKAILEDALFEEVEG